MILGFAIEILISYHFSSRIRSLLLPPKSLQIAPNRSKIKNKKIAPGALSPSSEGVRMFCWVFSNSENHASCVGDVFKAFPALYRHEQSPVQIFVRRVPKYSGFRLEFSEQTLKSTGRLKRFHLFFIQSGRLKSWKVVDLSGFHLFWARWST